MFEAQPLNNQIYRKALEQKITSITLRFSGGSDEGYLYVYIDPEERRSNSFVKEIEDWAWSVYEYNGAGYGEGDYGDTVTYDLTEGKVHVEEWHQKIVYGESYSSPLSLESPKPITKIKIPEY